MLMWRFAILGTGLLYSTASDCLCYDCLVILFPCVPKRPRGQFLSHSSQEILGLNGAHVAVVTEVYIAEIKSAVEAGKDETVELKVLRYIDNPAVRWELSKAELWLSSRGEEKPAPTPENTNWGPY
jgi:hypothetical protein